jgi:hypothetical protein
MDGCDAARILPPARSSRVSLTKESLRPGEALMRRWILRVEDEAAYNDWENIKTKFRKAAQIPDEDLVIVTLSMSVTLVETKDD